MPMLTHDAGPTSRQDGHSSLPELVGELTGQMGRLAKQEFLLAKIELRENANAAKKGGAKAGTGAALLFYAGALLVAAAVVGLTRFMPLWASALTVGGVLAVAGFSLMKAGSDEIRFEFDHLPESMRANAEFVRERMSAR